MRTKWSGTVSQDAVLIKLRRRLKLILSSWAVHKKEKKRSLWKGRKKEWEKKEKTGEKWAYPQLSIVKRGRQRNFIWERESARKEVSTTYLRFFMRCIRGKVNCTVAPPPPRKKIPSNCLLYLLHWKLLILPHFLCSLYFSTGSVFAPAIPFSFPL